MQLRNIVIVVLALSFSVARADTYTTFDASGTFESGATLSGTLTFDSTTEIVTAVDLSVSGPDSLTFNAVAQSCYYPIFGYCTIQAGYNSTNSGNLLVMVVPVSIGVEYTGSALASDNAPAGGYVSNIAFGSGGYDNLVSGALTATPEPSSLLLLGTGLAGALEALRRRRRSI